MGCMSAELYGRLDVRKWSRKVSTEGGEGVVRSVHRRSKRISSSVKVMSSKSTAIATTRKIIQFGVFFKALLREEATYRPGSCEPVGQPNSYKLDRIRPLFAARAKQHELLLSWSNWSAKDAPKRAQRPKADNRLEYDDEGQPALHPSFLSVVWFWRLPICCPQVG